ncbi:Helix-turn-helix [Cohaesibacter gelatinilyticus]|uniref:Helix-turn-helix n=2 Tax=Cohaesibacter gelatinilyticus TaxID=372072 RepID=A0A285PBI3_9HYPH|nr:Helix-turn-helix [Cohaesibacter gelatinilyticus]
MKISHYVVLITTYDDNNLVVNKKSRFLSSVANYATDESAMGIDIKINKDWFLTAFKDKGTSLRQAAKHLEIDPSAMSRILSGQRKLQMSEAQELARFLNVPVAEVLAQAGMDIHEVPENSTIQLTREIDGDGLLSARAEPTALQYHIVAKAKTSLASDKSVVAAEVSALDGSFAFWDGATVLFRDAIEVEGQLADSLCVVTLSDGTMRIAHIGSTRPSGESTLTLPDGKKFKDTIKTATPILAVIP